MLPTASILLFQKQISYKICDVGENHYLCDMINLARHISFLLLENDCVIVPGFGGFITHHVPATCDTSKGIFIPPARIIGFNPLLKINDGLLVQSYMQTYNLGFRDAALMVKKDTNDLLKELHDNGKADLQDIGQLRCNIQGKYDFEPYEKQVSSPGLYGFGFFEMKELDKAEVHVAQHHANAVTRRRTALKIRFNASHIANIAATIAAIVFFFALSTPLENTEVMKGNYAQIFSSDLFMEIGMNSLAVTPITSTQTTEEKARQAQTPAALSGNAVQLPVQDIHKESDSSENVKTETGVQTSASGRNIDPVIQKPYHIIVASVGNSKKGKMAAEQLKNEGYEDAKVIIGDGKVRVGICSYATEKEAYSALQEFRKEDAYKSAWVLKKKI